MDFEEWFKSHRYSDVPLCYGAAKDAFKAGQQSKQAEIDALKEQQKKLQAIYDDCTEYTTISELLDSIKEILK